MKENLAEKYGVSEKRIKSEFVDFIECEGYLPDNGHECMTFGEWLDKRFSAVLSHTEEPFQKGDMNYGL